MTTEEFNNMVTEGTESVTNVFSPVTGAEGVSSDTTEGLETYTTEAWPITTDTAPHIRWGVSEEDYNQLVESGATKNAWGDVMKTQEEYNAIWRGNTGDWSVPAITQQNQEVTTTPAVSVLTDTLENVAIGDGTPNGTE